MTKTRNSASRKLHDTLMIKCKTTGISQTNLKDPHCNKNMHIQTLRAEINLTISIQHLWLLVASKAESVFITDNLKVDSETKLRHILKVVFLVDQHQGQDTQVLQHYQGGCNSAICGSSLLNEIIYCGYCISHSEVVKWSGAWYI